MDNTFSENTDSSSTAMPQFTYNKFAGLDFRGIGERMRKIREDAGYSVNAMSKCLNLTEAGLRKLEYGNSLPSGRTLITLHETLGADLVWLLFGRHSTHDDILSALYAADDDVLFDIFVRLYSYFSGGNHSVFCPQNGTINNVPGVKEWDGTYYRRIEHTDQDAHFEKQYTDEISYKKDP